MDNKNIKLIDVTLRDGGYKTNFHFNQNVVQTLLTSLEQSGIEYVEIGYRNGSFKPIQNMGETGYCQNEYIDYCGHFLSRSKLTVMVHPKNITEHDLKEMHQHGVKAIRVCFFPQYKQETLKTLEMLGKYSFDVFINLVRVSQVKPLQLLNWIQEFSVFKLQGIYLADSNGSLNPMQVNHLFQYLKEYTDIPLGFHAHDNLFLAQANAIAALDAGALYLDGSLHGLGKGGGNLRTEIIATLLNKKNHSHYDICHLLSTAQSITQLTGIQMGLLSAKEIIHGMFNFSQDEISMLGDFKNINSYYESAKNYYETNSHNRTLSA